MDGIGIHTGAPCRVVVHPAEPGLGRQFRSGGVTIPAHIEFVVDTTRCTTLGRDGIKISTVEHLLSALAGTGVDNCLIDVDGPEIPILDGSALPFVEAIRSAGIAPQPGPARMLHLTEPLRIAKGTSEANARPAPNLELTVSTEFDEWAEGAATVMAAGAGGMVEDYAESIAPARTFAFRREVDMLIAAGLAKGGSLDNALIISPPDTFSTPQRLRSEWCVHKMLDLIGDLALLNARLAMKIEAIRPGHGTNAILAKSILAQSRE